MARKLSPLAGSTLDNIIKEQAEQAFGVRFRHNKNLNVYCPYCEDPRTSTSKSCSVSLLGVFRCHVCKRTGTAKDFVAALAANGHPQRPAVPTNGNGASNGNTAPPRPLSEAMVEEWHRNLLTTTDWRHYLNTKRGINDDTIKKYRLGHDELRITIPVYDDYNGLRTVRRYAPQSVPKMLYYSDGSGSAALYPGQNLPRYSDAPYILLCEGEWDTLLAIQKGFAAITTTAGVLEWSEEFTNKLVAWGKPIVICYDVNDKDNDLGQRVAQERAAILHAAGLYVRVLRLPLDGVGEDITDWFITYKRTAKELSDLINALPQFIPPMPDDNTSVQEDEPVLTPPLPMITLIEASKADMSGQEFRLKCLVAGKAPTPYVVPMDMMVYPCDIHGDSTATGTAVSFDNDKIGLLSLIGGSVDHMRSVVRTKTNFKPTDRTSTEVFKSVNIEEIYLIPTLEDAQKANGAGGSGGYVMRQAYYMGQGIEPNHVYEFVGTSIPHPKTQAATHLFTQAIPSDTDIDAFELNEKQKDELWNTFHNEDVHAKLQHIAQCHAQSVTHIYGRDDLHTAIDLVFHSPLQFTFAGTTLRKGWLECLILGDTRTGKGCVTEGLTTYYGLGEVVSGENLSFAGLVGGIDKISNSHALVWGKLPLNDRRLVVMDECGSLPQQIIGQLSRIRSEGVAEITKIRAHKTTSRTRLIWLSNPRPAPNSSPRLMADYTYGVEAVNELIGASEDVARFDFVLTVSQNEVDSNVINREHQAPATPSPYTKELCHRLIMWAWSRRAEHIRFPQEVTTLIMAMSKQLGKQFSPKVCLIQTEDIRFKLARIAVAAASRTFSSTDGIHLDVTVEHVEWAYNFIHQIYSKASCGYLQYSQQEIEHSTLRNPAAILEAIHANNTRPQDLVLDIITYLYENKHIHAMDLCDATNVDIFEGRALLSALIRARAIVKEHNYYIKRPAFRLWLQATKANLLVHTEYHTQEDNDNDNP